MAGDSDRTAAQAFNAVLPVPGLDFQERTGRKSCAIYELGGRNRTHPTVYDAARLPMVTEGSDFSRKSKKDHAKLADTGRAVCDDRTRFLTVAAL